MRSIELGNEPATSILKRDDNPKTVLLVEDSLGDVRLTLEAFQEDNKSVKLHVVPDGAAALDFLKRRGNTPPPPGRSSYYWT